MVKPLRGASCQRAGGGGGRADWRKVYGIGGGGER